MPSAILLGVVNKGLNGPVDCKQSTDIGKSLQIEESLSDSLADMKSSYFSQISELRRKLPIMKVSVLLASLLLFSLAYAEDNETKVQFKDLPPALQKTAKKQEQRGTTVSGYNKEIENGKTFFEVETRVNGKSRDILMDESGAVVEVEQQVEIGNVPFGAMQGLKREAAGANILHVESVTKGGKVSYEAVILRNGKKKEIAVNADGTALYGREPVDGTTCEVVELIPKRRSPYLLKGRMWVDPAGAMIVKIEGKPSASVSFFEGRPQVVREYKKIGSFALAQRVHAESSSFLFGKSTVDIEYRNYHVVARNP